MQDPYIYLNKDSVLHADMIEPLNISACRVIYSEPDGVLLYNIPSDIHMLSAASAEACERMIALVEPTDVLFNAHHPYEVELIQKRFSLPNAKESIQAVWTKPYAPIRTGKYTVRQLGEEYISVLAANYHSIDTDEQYIRERVKSGVMYGAFDGITLLGFMGMHSEGSMGLLVVFPEYRNKGVATELECFYIDLLLRSGKRPYGQIFKGNGLSMELQTNLGFEFAKESVWWIYA